MKFTNVALLGAATFAMAENHNHVHRHSARHGSPVQGRDAAVVETVPGPVVTIYELNGQDITYNDVEDGLKSGKYVLVGEKISKVIPAPTSTSTSTSTSASSSSSVEAAVFFQKPTISSTAIVPTKAPVAAPAAAASPHAAAPAAGSAGGNVNAEFPSGTIPCSHFPSDYGAVAVDWLGLGGWSGVQKVPNYHFGVDAAISYIETAISGSGCTPNSFCSYACPAGHQKSQWPSSQGNTGQSIGGLFCNSNGMLELSRSSVPQICVAGVGNVKVSNKLGQNVAICRTDYPGTEGETIPLDTRPGQIYDLTCPDAATYYQWEGSYTSAQYYINPAGASVSDACQWGSAGTNLGNWAPVNCGVGKGIDGMTYISLFPNAPTNPDGVLNFSIKITGGVSGDCSYTNGKYYNNGVESATGCTVSVSGTATFEFS